MPKPCPDAGLIKAMEKRDGMLTVAILNDGSECHFLNMHYGYDLGETVALITTNDNPRVEHLRSDYFETDQIVALLDAETRQALFSFPQGN